MITERAVFPLRVLLIEDSSADVEIATEAFDDAQVAAEFTVAKNGHLALALLRAMTDEPEQAPHVVLLDLNLPRIGGIQVLEFIRADPMLRALMVVVTTTSRSPLDLERCLALQAARILHKPLTVAQVIDLVDLVQGHSASV